MLLCSKISMEHFSDSITTVYFFKYNNVPKEIFEPKGIFWLFHRNHINEYVKFLENKPLLKAST